MTRPSLLIVPGASGLPEFYDPFIEAVTEKGYDIKALHIPSVGLATGAREGPLPTMYDDAEFVAKHVRELADLGHDVILITHSYGGTPATESVKGITKKERQKQGLKGGIIGIAYMTSLVPNIGGSAGGVKAAFPDEEKVPMAIDENGWFYYPDIPKLAELSFSNMPKDEGEFWAAKLVKHSSTSFANLLTYAGFKDVPVSYLLCENDRAISPLVQRAGIEMIEKESGNKVDVKSIAGDHVAPLSSKTEVVDWIVGVAECMGSVS
ncbi:AB hydrolase-1 domain-containing protein [Fusarium sp. LHS14.1]|nr:AB hydrolase-1 domain-containing protein [Fusarium sp. LHS14.1]